MSSDDTSTTTTTTTTTTSTKAVSAFANDDDVPCQSSSDGNRASEQEVDNKPIKREHSEIETTRESNNDSGDGSVEDEVDDGDPNEEENNSRKHGKTSLSFVPWNYLTYNTLKQCMSFGTPKESKDNKAAMIRFSFNYEKFKTVCPDCPPIDVLQDKVLITNMPLQLCPWGYSPKQEDDGKVTNELRFSMDQFATEASRKFQGPPTHEESNIPVEELYGMRGWDRFFCDTIHEKLNNGEWRGVNIPLFKSLVGNPPCKMGELAYRDVMLRWKPTIRLGKEPYPNYFQLKCKIQYADILQNLKEDPWTAYLNVWDSNGTLLNADGKLYKKNGSKYDAKNPDKHVIFGPDTYAEAIWSPSHINICAANMGLTGYCLGVKIYTREQALASKHQKSVCPL